jgi:hypothetical protein
MAVVYLPRNPTWFPEYTGRKPLASQMSQMMLNPDYFGNQGLAAEWLIRMGCRPSSDTTGELWDSDIVRNIPLYHWWRTSIEITGKGPAHKTIADEGYLYTPVTSQLDHLSAASFEYWIYPTALNKYYVYKLGSGGSFFTAWWESGVPCTYLSTIHADAPSAAIVNTWNHVVFTWGANSLRTYLNGVSGSPVTVNAPKSAATGNIVFGTVDSDGVPGFRSSYALRNRALLPSEVAQLYIAPYGTPGNPKFLSLIRPVYFIPSLSTTPTLSQYAFRFRNDDGPESGIAGNSKPVYMSRNPLWFPEYTGRKPLGSQMSMMKLNPDYFGNQGLAAEWLMNEGAGYPIRNLVSGRFSTSTGTAAPSVWAIDETGLYKSYPDRSGTPQYDLVDTVTFTGPCLIIMWVNFTTINERYVLGSAGTNKIGHASGSNYLRVRFLNGGTADGTTVPHPGNGVKFFYAVRRDAAAKIDLFVNNTKYRMFSDAAQSGASSWARIGNDDSNNRMHGNIHSVQLFNGTYTDHQINAVRLNPYSTPDNPKFLSIIKPVYFIPGTVAAASFKAAENANISLSSSLPARIRFLVNANNAPNSPALKLEFKKQGDSIWTPV